MFFCPYWPCQLKYLFGFKEYETDVDSNADTNAGTTALCPGVSIDIVDGIGSLACKSGRTCLLCV